MSPKKAEPNVPADKLALYEQVVASVPGVERKGAKVPYTSLNGNMYSYLDEDGTMVLRLAAKERQAFLEQYKTRLHTAYGVVQKEYVDVPEALLNDVPEASRYFGMSYEYARSLKPKPTKR
jgi:hypothetical protein